MRNRRPIYKGEVVDLGLEDAELPNGEHMTLEVVRHPGGAAVVAVDAEHRICLLRQYRHAVGGWIWELPAGKIDAPEPAEQTARRELREEAGLSAERWRFLGAFLSTPGFCDERIYLYQAEHLEHVPDEPHPHEVIEVHWLDRDTIRRLIESGDIADGKTLLGLLLADPSLCPVGDGGQV